MGLLIGLLCILFVAWPFLFPSREGQKRLPAPPVDELQELIARREAVYSAIRDLDFDFETGKLEDEDYRLQRETWIARGVEVLKAIDAYQALHPQERPLAQTDSDGAGAPPAAADLDAQIEAAVAARRRTA